MYDFVYGGKRLGGTAAVKRSETSIAEYAPGQPVAVRYDPLLCDLLDFGYLPIYPY